MSYRFQLDPEQRLAVVSCYEELGIIVLCEMLEKFGTDPQFATIDKVLVALTYDACQATSRPEVERNAAVTAAALQGKELRIAIVAPHDLTYGLSRMFSAMLDDERIRVFRLGEEAYAWLKVTEPRD